MCLRMTGDVVLNTGKEAVARRLDAGRDGVFQAGSRSGSLECALTSAAPPDMGVDRRAPRMPSCREGFCPACGLAQKVYSSSSVSGSRGDGCGGLCLCSIVHVGPARAQCFPGRRRQKEHRDLFVYGVFAESGVFFPSWLPWCRSAGM